MVKELTKISLNECLRKYDVKFDNAERYLANKITISKEQIGVFKESPYDDEAVIIGGNWNDVTFIVTGKIKLSFYDSIFKNVTFCGDNLCPEDEIESHLKLGQCRGSAISIYGIWSSVSFTENVVFDELILEGIIKSCIFNCAFVKNISDKAINYHCTLENTVFENGKWLPDIRMGLKLIPVDVQFNNTKIDVAPIFQYCNPEVRERLNLTKADIVADKWAKLRDTYTGLQLTLVLFLTTVFGFPYIFKVFFYIFSDKIIPETLKETVTNIPLWQILLLNDKPITSGWYYSVPAILLIIYNITRLYLTVSVNRMREREEHLHMYGFSLYKPNCNSRKFKIDWKIHYVLFRLQILVICLAIYRFVEVLLKDIPVFLS